ncbi:putative 20S proteasome beta2 subunit [Jaminaea rosea]|uniref:proteasome endopeptidase complex n=1 Tax=Jaminaea rosea TaxID=1569628 RepID=A0A316UZK4_9BASI|nr:putative 20S proteasome beta2 subunit [Jaminaea rosea]PWN28605.1 putative 20S proteasome beta2 subunit [Jaminaea rosea]
MAAPLNARPSASGFDFGSISRNHHLTTSGSVRPPKATSTGTTLAACRYPGGVVIGGDTRATEGPIVADPDCEKVHYLSPFIRCAGAGTAADTEMVTAEISSNLMLHELHTGRRPRVVTALTMLKQKLFQYQGNIGAALLLGGVDDSGCHLFSVAPHGSTDKLPFCAMGSGSLAAIAVLESGFKQDLTKDEAIALVSNAILGGIFNDLGSGSNVDISVITDQGTEYLRHHIMPNQRGPKEQKYLFPKGVTAYTKEAVYDMVVQEDILAVGNTGNVVPPAGGGEGMDTGA